MIKRLKNEDGYSLVEVVVSILLLSIAIIPMVGMFDAGLKASSTSGNYDKARSFANEMLENAKSGTYAATRDSFPVASSTPSGGGSYTSSDLSVPVSVGLSDGSTYEVVKQYLDPAGSASNPISASGTASFGATSGTDQGLMRVTVTVKWNGNEYKNAGVVAG